MVIEKVRRLAEEYYLNPNTIEGIYREMITSFINLELDEHSKLNRKERKKEVI